MHKKLIHIVKAYAALWESTKNVSDLTPWNLNEFRSALNASEIGRALVEELSTYSESYVAELGKCLSACEPLTVEGVVYEFPTADASAQFSAAVVEDCRHLSAKTVVCEASAGKLDGLAAKFAGKRWQSNISEIADLDMLFGIAMEHNAKGLLGLAEYLQSGSGDAGIYEGFVSATGSSLNESTPGTAETEPNTAAVATAASDDSSRGSAVQQPDAAGGAVAQSQAEPEQKAPEPNQVDANQNQQKNGGLGTITLPNGTEVPESILMHKVGEVLIVLGNQMVSGASQGKQPDPNGQTMAESMGLVEFQDDFLDESDVAQQAVPDMAMQVRSDLQSLSQALHSLRTMSLVSLSAMLADDGKKSQANKIQKAINMATEMRASVDKLTKVIDGLSEIPQQQQATIEQEPVPAPMAESVPEFPAVSENLVADAINYLVATGTSDEIAAAVTMKERAQLIHDNVPRFLSEAQTLQIDSGLQAIAEVLNKPSISISLTPAEMRIAEAVSDGQNSVTKLIDNINNKVALTPELLESACSSLESLGDAPQKQLAREIRESVKAQA